MSATEVSRRDVMIAMTALPASVCALGSNGPAAREAAPANGGAGLSRSSEAIHQELAFRATCARVYEVLTSAARFDALIRLSDAVTLLTAPHAEVTAISTEVGGPFTLFGGYITGRQLEMVPNERLVQAWRTRSWKAGEYSVVSFALADKGGGCRLVFDHRGFPDGDGESLAYGWGVHYWEPLAKLLEPA